MTKSCGTHSYNYQKIYQVCHMTMPYGHVIVICYSEFITELLKNVGTHIDPTKLIKVSQGVREKVEGEK